MDPVRRLPQLLAAYLPPTPTATKSGEWMDASTGDESGGTVGGVGELQLRAAVQEAVQVEVDAALAKILAAQADGFARLAQTL
ncbi:hypothetical protein FOA52_009477 [Chlamydomonas sp. UWO 241]|nr:hypothetical protein FOA52_009477 [Chlamydomonas sp. UWO 241]